MATSHHNTDTNPLSTTFNPPPEESPPTSTTTTTPFTPTTLNNSDADPTDKDQLRQILAEGNATMPPEHPIVEAPKGTEPTTSTTVLTATDKSKASSDADDDSDSSSSSSSSGSDSESDSSSSSSDENSNSDSDSDSEDEDATQQARALAQILKARKKQLTAELKQAEKALKRQVKAVEKGKKKKTEPTTEPADQSISELTEPPTTTTEKEKAEKKEQDKKDSKKKDKKKKAKAKVNSATAALLDPASNLSLQALALRGRRAAPADPEVYKKMLEDAGLAKKEKEVARASVLDFKRVDRRYNKERYTFEVVESSETTTIDKYKQYLFTVRRIFGYDNKYQESKVDVKSRSLKELLRRSMGEIKGMSLVEDTPAIDPNMLFNYMGEMEEEIERLEGIVAAKKKMVDDAPKTEEKKETKQKWDVCDTAAAIDTTNGAAPAEDTKEATNLDKGKSKAIEEKPVDKKDKKSRKKAQSKDKHSKSKDGKSKKKTKKEAPATPENIIAHGRILLRYLNEDYKSTKASLFPLLDAGLITFDLLWALFKPNTLVYTVCPGTDEPRAFIVEFTEVHSNIMRGTWLAVEGRYLEFVGLPEEQRKAGKIQVTENDGKGGFGWGKTTVDIDSFTGSRRIDTLRCYPMKYRPDAEEMKRRLIERGRKFVTLAGMQYKNHKGLAFLRNKKGQIVKLNLNGRIMIDPALFRRMNPNYIVSSVRPRSADLKSARELNVFTSSKNGRARRVGEESDSESEEEGGCCGGDEEDEGVEKEEESKEETVKYYFDESGNLQVYNPEELVKKENEAAEIDGKTTIGFSDEEFMLASSVVLGFSFPEKLWLEISVAGVSDIIWNDTAFDTLVLPNSSKEIVKALVETHTGSRMESTTIDDIIQGKGRGLVSVLHGPPGTGKTLTAESIAELLHKPLYMVSSGELGTTAHVLEEGLNRILDIAHTWDAVLLLDEADVFLEKRTMHDLHRNALVSVFLRLLEYFQGILFLTTNRVQSFDEAFQSRIHVALRYDDLTFSAKKQIWTNFINMVFEKEKTNGLALLRRENAEKEKERREKKGTAVSSSSSSVSSRSKGKKGEEESMLTDAILSESDVNMLATKSFNGRQIKNIVRTAQSLAASKKQPLGIAHIKQVIAVAESFDNDLKGGTGYIENLRSYA